MNYGKELIIDLHDCDSNLFNRTSLNKFFKELCELIGMKREDMHFWDDYEVPKKDRETEPHLKGTSAIQFIKTSNITIHTLDILKRVYINIFSCKDFYTDMVINFTVDFFKGKLKSKLVVDRI